MCKFSQAVSLFVIAILTTGAYAEKNELSEFNHHAMGGRFEITPSYTSYKAVGKLRPTDDVTITGSDIGLKLEYGISRIGIGIQAAQIDHTTKQAGSNDSTEKGISDVTALLRGSTDGDFRLVFGGRASFSHEKSKELTLDHYNAVNGGTTIAPEAGFEMGKGFLVWGARADYSMYGERSFADVNGIVTKTKGGNGYGVWVFAEVGSATFKAGLAARYGQYSATKDTDAAGVETDNLDENTVTGVNIYLPIAAGDNFTIVPSYKHMITKFRNIGSTYTTFTETSPRVDLRMSF